MQEAVLDPQGCAARLLQPVSDVCDAKRTVLLPTPDWAS